MEFNCRLSFVCGISVGLPRRRNHGHKSADSESAGKSNFDLLDQERRRSIPRSGLHASRSNSRKIHPSESHRLHI